MACALDRSRRTLEDLQAELRVLESFGKYGRAKIVRAMIEHEIEVLNHGQTREG